VVADRVKLGAAAPIFNFVSVSGIPAQEVS